jgi:hypothetical protein
MRLDRYEGQLSSTVLGEAVAAMPFPYPTSGSNAASLPDKASIGNGLVTTAVSLIFISNWVSQA